MAHNETFDYVGVVVFVGRQERERRVYETEQPHDRYLLLYIDSLFTLL